MSTLSSKVVVRLHIEKDAQVQRRLIAILSYMAEGSTSGNSAPVQ